MSKLKYLACQRVRFTACETLHEGVIDFAVSTTGDGDPLEDTLYDIEDDQGRMFYGVPEVQVHGLATPSPAERVKLMVRAREMEKGGQQ